MVTMQHGIPASEHSRRSPMVAGFYGAERAQIKQEVLAAGAEYSGQHLWLHQVHIKSAG